MLSILYKKLFLPMFITLSDGFHFGIKKLLNFDSG